MSSDLVVCFPHVDGAEHAFADVRERSRHAPWLDEVAFVEHRRSGRLVVRGTIAGHYLWRFRKTLSDQAVAAVETAVARAQ